MATGLRLRRCWRVDPVGSPLMSVIAHAAGQNWLVDNGGRVLPGEIYPEPDSSLRYAPMAGELPSRSARCSSSLALRIFP